MGGRPDDAKSEALAERSAVRAQRGRGPRGSNAVAEQVTQTPTQLYLFRFLFFQCYDASIPAYNAVQSSSALHHPVGA